MNRELLSFTRYMVHVLPDVNARILTSFFSKWTPFALIVEDVGV